MEQSNDTLSIKMEDIQINETTLNSFKIEDIRTEEDQMAQIPTPEEYNAKLSVLENAPDNVKNSGESYKRLFEKREATIKKINNLQRNLQDDEDHLRHNDEMVNAWTTILNHDCNPLCPVCQRNAQPQPIQQQQQPL